MLMTKELTEIMREYQYEMREEELRNETLKAEGRYLKIYNVQIKVAGSTRQCITLCAPNALTAIENVIAGLSVRSCNEYIAREVKSETLSLGS